MLFVVALLVIAIILPGIFDEDRSDIILNEYCNNECISRQNKKRKFCC